MFAIIVGFCLKIFWVVGDDFSKVDWGFGMLNGIKLKFEGVEQIV